MGVCSEADISCGASFAPYMLAGSLTLGLLIAGVGLMDKGWKEDRKDDD